MKDENVGGVHWSFWAVSAITLIWNVMGVINFFVSKFRVGSAQLFELKEKTFSKKPFIQA